MEYLHYLKNITNIILLVINLMFYIPFIIIKCKISISNKNIDNTEKTFEHDVGLLMSIVAMIRFGKTSLSMGIIFVLEKIKIRQMKKRMDSYINLLYFFDFAKMNFCLDELCPKGDEQFYGKQKELTESCMKLCEIPHGVINDFINVKSIFDILYDYAELYYVYYYRGVYVYSKTWRYSFNTKKDNLYLSDETQNIKEIDTNKEFYIRNWSVILEDEINVFNGNIHSTSLDFKDRGRKEHKSLFGNMYKETNHYLSIKQFANDEISNEKNLYTNNFMGQERKIYNNFKLIIKYLELKSKILKFIHLINYKLFFFHKSTFTTFDMFVKSNKCKYRRKNQFNDYLKRYLESLAFVDYKMYDYYKTTDVGKDNTVSNTYYKERLFTFNLRDTIGIYLTHDYEFLPNILHNKSNIHIPKENSAFKDEKTKKYMTRFLDEHKEKEQKEISKALRKKGIKVDDVESGVDEY